MTMSTRLIVARHGNTFGPEDVVRRVGITDLPLVDSGLQQGYRLGAYLKINHLIPDVIFTSTLKRTIQTAEQAQKAMQTRLEFQKLSIFNEIDYGPDENQPEENVLARLGRDALIAWEKKAKVPSGWQVEPQEIIQHWHDFSAQLLREHVGKTILVVTSNGIARFAPYLTGDFSRFCEAYTIKLSTGALGVFEYSTSLLAWSCLQWNVKPIAMI